MNRKRLQNPHAALLEGLMELADGDRDAICSAVEAAHVAGQDSVSLKSVTREILKARNPALLATIEAAEDFAKAVGFQDRLVALPWIAEIYDLAVRNEDLPKRIFNAAAEHPQRSPGNDNLDDVLGTIVLHQQKILTLN